MNEPKKKQPKSYVINVGKKGYEDITTLAKLMKTSRSRFVMHAVRSLEIIRTLNSTAMLERPRKETR